MLKIIITIILVLLVAMIAFGYYIGLFSTPKVTEQTMGEYIYAYEEFVGDYKKTAPVFENVNKILANLGVKSTRGIGVYFDNPKEVPTDKLRSNCGSIIEEQDYPKVDTIATTLKIGKLNSGQSIVVELPLKNVISYMVGPMKAYPALMKYAQAKNFKTTLAYEIYDMAAKKIYYVMPVK